MFAHADLIHQIRRKTAQDYSQKDELEVVKAENEALRELVASLRTAANDLGTAYNEARSTLRAKGLPTPQYEANTVADLLDDGTHAGKKRARKLSAIAAVTGSSASSRPGQDEQDQGQEHDGGAAGDGVESSTGALGRSSRTGSVAVTLADASTQTGHSDDGDIGMTLSLSSAASRAGGRTAMSASKAPVTAAGLAAALSLSRGVSTASNASSGSLGNGSIISDLDRATAAKNTHTVGTTTTVTGINTNADGNNSNDDDGFDDLFGPPSTDAFPLMVADLSNNNSGGKAAGNGKKAASGSSASSSPSAAESQSSLLSASLESMRQRAEVNAGKSLGSATFRGGDSSSGGSDVTMGKVMGGVGRSTSVGMMDEDHNDGGNPISLIDMPLLPSFDRNVGNGMLDRRQHRIDARAADGLMSGTISMASTPTANPSPSGASIGNSSVLAAGVGAGSLSNAGAPASSSSAISSSALPASTASATNGSNSFTMPNGLPIDPATIRKIVAVLASQGLINTASAGVTAGAGAGSSITPTSAAAAAVASRVFGGAAAAGSGARASRGSSGVRRPNMRSSGLRVSTSSMGNSAGNGAGYGYESTSSNDGDGAAGIMRSPSGGSGSGSGSGSGIGAGLNLSLPPNLFDDLLFLNDLPSSDGGITFSQSLSLRNSNSLRNRQSSTGGVDDDGANAAAGAGCIAKPGAQAARLGVRMAPLRLPSFETGPSVTSPTPSSSSASAAASEAPKPLAVPGPSSLLLMRMDSFTHPQLMSPLNVNSSSNNNSGAGSASGPSSANGTTSSRIPLPPAMHIPRVNSFGSTTSSGSGRMSLSSSSSRSLCGGVDDAECPDVGLDGGATPAAAGASNAAGPAVATSALTVGAGRLQQHRDRFVRQDSDAAMSVSSSHGERSTCSASVASSPIDVRDGADTLQSLQRQGQPGVIDLDFADRFFATPAAAINAPTRGAGRASSSSSSSTVNATAPLSFPGSTSSLSPADTSFGAAASSCAAFGLPIQALGNAANTSTGGGVMLGSISSSQQMIQNQHHYPFQSFYGDANAAAGVSSDITGEYTCYGHLAGEPLPARAMLVRQGQLPIGSRPLDSVATVMGH